MFAKLNMLLKFMYQRKDVPKDFPLGSVLGPVGFDILSTDPNGRLENRLIKFRGKCSLVHCNYFGRQEQDSKWS